MDNDKAKSKYRSYFVDDKYNENNYNQRVGDDNNTSNFDKGGLDDDRPFSFKNMDKDRKVALIILSAFSLLVGVILFLNIRHLMNDPFVVRDPETGKILKRNEGSPILCSGPNCQPDSNSLNPENLNLKLIDTDGDGISDWDELFIYGTSPYLEDTSGDGITDYEAIFVYDIDPLCPAGQDCSGSSVVTPGDVSGDKPEQTTGQNMDDLYNLLNITSQDSNLDSMTSENIDPISQLYSDLPAQIRAELINAGFSAEDIDLLSDEDLIRIYSESLEYSE